MNVASKTLENIIKELPPDMKSEVENFVNILLKKRDRNHRKKLRQDWAGALKDYQDQYTALEL